MPATDYVKKGAWSPEEDHKLVSCIIKYGIWNWTQMPKYAGLARTGKSCRLRWMNYLRPDVRRGPFSTEEVEIIVQLYLSLGNRWSAIAARLPGRTDNEVKNFFHTHLKKRLPPAERGGGGRLRSRRTKPTSTSTTINNNDSTCKNIVQNNNININNNNNNNNLSDDAAMAPMISHHQPADSANSSKYVYCHDDQENEKNLPVVILESSCNSSSSSNCECGHEFPSSTITHKDDEDRIAFWWGILMEADDDHRIINNKL